jgi:hypothetical protein
VSLQKQADLQARLHNEHYRPVIREWYRSPFAPTIGQVIIGLDASGNFPAGGQGFESSAVAAATVPEKARANITAWTAGRSEAWNRADLSELHANQLEPHERREVCGMLSARDDLHVAVIITSNLLLRSEEMVAGHRQRQLAVAEQAATSAITEEGRRRGETAARPLDNQRVGVLG